MFVPQTHVLVNRFLTSWMLAILCVVLFTLDASAGKLGSVRSKTRPSKAQQTAPSSRSPEQDEDDERPKRETRQQNTRRNQTVARSSRSNGKLAAVRDRTRRERPRPRPSIDRGGHARPHTSRRPRPRPRRPQRSGIGPSFGLGFGSTFGFDACPTAIVEEHHYYGPSEAWIVSEPVVTPVMPAEPVIRAQVIEEPAYEPIPCDPFPCEPESISEEMVTGWGLNPFQVRFEIDYAGDEEDVSRMGFGLLLNATNGLGIDTGARLFRERGADLRDHMWVGDFNVTYELLATDLMRTRAGIGFNFLSDAFGGDAGLNLTVGSDLFLGPVTLTGEADLGTIGDADLFHGRISAAIRCSDHLESFVGYDYLDVGGVEFSGLLAGVRFRY